MVYPGANHTRFHHAIGAMYLMENALNVLKTKGVFISEEEHEACMLAILLHDIGHGPFSHTLEFSLFTGIHHEEITLRVMHKINEELNGYLDLAIMIFRDVYERRFFHQLVSSQLDMDRLDYLKRDGYYTGVVESSVATERIISMLNVADDQVVVEEKGIYSIENFLSSRRLMYWQVYLHKATLSSEAIMRAIIARAKELILIKKLTDQSRLAQLLICTDQDLCLQLFLSLDDVDVLYAIKDWAQHDDRLLSDLCHRLLTRKLFRTTISIQPFSSDDVSYLLGQVEEQLDYNPTEARYLVHSGKLSNAAYLPVETGSIKILKKTGELVDIAQASDLPNIKAMRKVVEKYYLCWPKEIKSKRI